MDALAEKLITKTLDLGATVAGIANMGDLLSCSSHDGFPIAAKAGEQDSVLVVGLDHPPSKPDLDWYIGRGGTEGNRILMRINAALGAWLQENYGVLSQDLHYYAERGGVFLKDAAVLAGLGAVGINNMLVVPRYGPNLRFRALLVNAPLLPAKRSDYSPCEGCDKPCLYVCPEGALDGGIFNREACLRHMAKDGAGDLMMDLSTVKVKDPFGFCRLCELACPLSRRDQ
jgi:epoxyqueuosine reductase